MKTDIGKDKHCNYHNFKRARYFHGMLLTDRDFREEQIYHNEKRKLHNRLLHGWGVVCGLGIKADSPPSSKIIITPGMALDCCGNEILVCEDFEVDLKKPPGFCPDTSGKGSDPCGEKPDENGDQCKYYVAIKYTEIRSDPEAVYAPGNGCEDKTCDYTRTREGFCVKLFKSTPCRDRLPEKGVIEKIVDCVKEDRSRDEMRSCSANGLESFHDSFCAEPYPCPDCCCDGEPYVVLGTVDFSKTNCKVKTIDPDMISIQDGRRYVLTFPFWQYFLGSFFKPIAESLNNPFRSICHILSSILPFIREISENTERETGGRPGSGMVARMSKVTGQSENEARKTLKAENLKYRRTIPLAQYNVMEIIGRLAGTQTFEKDMKVDLITDRRGKALFFVPVPELSTKVDDLEAMVAEYPGRIKSLERKIKTLDDLDKKKLIMLEKMELRLKDLENKLQRPNDG
jgi:hypothetical protein